VHVVEDLGLGNAFLLEFPDGSSRFALVLEMLVPGIAKCRHLECGQEILIDAGAESVRETVEDPATSSLGGFMKFIVRSKLTINGDSRPFRKGVHASIHQWEHQRDGD